jgi:hypothetical protein
MGMRRQWTGVVILITVSLTATLFLVPAIHAEPQNQSGYTGSDLIDALNKHNSTLWNTSHPVGNLKTLQPVTLFRAELNEIHLPGPRYMAFGPSVISLSIDPLLLAILITVVALSIGVWYVIRHKRDDEGEG